MPLLGLPTYNLLQNPPQKIPAQQIVKIGTGVP